MSRRKYSDLCSFCLDLRFSDSFEVRLENLSFQTIFEVRLELQQLNCKRGFLQRRLEKKLDEKMLP